MHETDTPTYVGANDGLGLTQERAAFDRLVLQLTGRDMDYHNRNGTTGLDTAWICYRGGVAAERARQHALLREAAMVVRALLDLHDYPQQNATMARIDAELSGAKQIVARHIGVGPSRIVTMSFPHGRWTAEILQRARSHGYELMFTSVPTLNRLVPGCSDVLGRVAIETNAVQDKRGYFRPDWLASRLFRRPVQRLG